MILVAGGTGLLGRKIVQRLDASGEQVRILTRDPARAANIPDRVQIVTGDVRHGPLEAAVEGCTCVVSVVHGFTGPTKTSPAAVDRDGNANLIAAAKRAGVPRYVLGSVVGAAPGHPLSLHRMKYAAEQELRRSGLTGVIVRATPFLETWIGVIGAKMPDGGPALVLGPGRNPINFVSADDVATFVTLAAIGDPRIGDEISIGGPANLSFTDIAEHLIAATGSTDPARHVPLGALRAMSVLARVINPDFARKAKAAVIMNTTDMTCNASTVRDRFPDIPATTLTQVSELVTSHRPT